MREPVRGSQPLNRERNEAKGGESEVKWSGRLAGTREVGGAASTLLRCLVVPELRDTESSLPNAFLAHRRLFYLLPANTNHPGKVPPSLAAAQQLDLLNWPALAPT